MGTAVGTGDGDGVGVAVGTGVSVGSGVAVWVGLTVGEGAKVAVDRGRLVGSNVAGAPEQPDASQVNPETIMMVNSTLTFILTSDF